MFKWDIAPKFTSKLLQLNYYVKLSSSPHQIFTSQRLIHTFCFFLTKIKCNFRSCDFMYLITLLWGIWAFLTVRQFIGICQNSFLCHFLKESPNPSSSCHIVEMLLLSVINSLEFCFRSSSIWVQTFPWLFRIIFQPHLFLKGDDSPSFLQFYKYVGQFWSLMI